MDNKPTNLDLTRLQNRLKPAIYQAHRVGLVDLASYMEQYIDMIEGMKE